MGLQVGAITPVFYAFRDREHVLNLIEAATGGRFHPNYDRIGGLKVDLPTGWIDECRRVMKKMLRLLRRVRGPRPRQRDLRGPHPGHRRDPPEVGAAYGVSGANLRAQRRRLGPAPRRGPATWSTRTSTGRSGPTPTATRFARYWVRLQETRESRRDRRPAARRPAAGPIMAKVPRIIKVPAGEAWVNTENPLGEMGYYVVSKGALGPFRVKIRSASFNNVSIVPWLLQGVYVPDVITILASLYFILGDIDR